MPEFISIAEFKRLIGRLYEIASPPATGTYPGKGKWTGSKVPKETPPGHPQHDINMTQAKKAGKKITKAMEPEEPEEPETPEEEPEEEPKKKKTSAESVLSKLSW